MCLGPARPRSGYRTPTADSACRTSSSWSWKYSTITPLEDVEENRPLLHLLFIEEPEAHLHAQLQQVFIRRVLSLVAEEAPSAFRSQLVVTTHSPHILYERASPHPVLPPPLGCGRTNDNSPEPFKFPTGEHPKDRDFLQRYLKLTHCDLFFADAALLVEGNVERLLLPLMIEKSLRRFAPLLSASSRSAAPSAIASRN